MPSLSNLINPNLDQVSENVDQQRELQYLDAEKLQGPTKWDLVKSSAEAAYVNGIGFKTVGRFFNEPDVKYDETQLKELYPDAPKDYFKGGASAYQAEMLYDKFKKQEEVELMKAMIYGNEDTSSPDWWIIGRNGRNTLPILSGIVTSFADPATIPAMLLGGMATRMALPFASRFAPEVTKRIAMSIGTSRLASNWVPEVMQNLAFEATSTYGLGKLNADFTKEDPTIKDALVNSVGTALLFGTASSVLRGYNVHFLQDSALHIQDAIGKGFRFNKDFLSMAMNSATHNVHLMQEAIKDYVSNPVESTKGIANKVFKRSATYSGEESFDTMGSKFVGIVDPEGNTLYTGPRRGDNHVFVDDSQVAQGMVNEYNISGEAELKAVTPEKLNKNALNIANLDLAVANDHPDILNIIEGHIGSLNDLELKEGATLADVFTAIDEAVATSDLSGSDLVKMYDEISQNLESKGFDGMSSLQDVDGKSHNVVEVFKNSMDEITDLGDARPTTTPKSVTDPLDSDVVVVGGKTIPAEPILHDPHLDLDEGFKVDYAKYNDPEFIKNIEVDDFNKHVEEDIKLKEEALVEDINADETLTSLDETSKVDSTFKEEIKKAKEEYKAEAPEKANEIFKVLENCKGKS